MMIRNLLVAMLCTLNCWADQSVISLIPKNLWQTYKTKTLPKPAFDAQQTWLNLNSGYSYFIFDDADIEANQVDEYMDEISIRSHTNHVAVLEESINGGHAVSKLREMSKRAPNVRILLWDIH